GDAAVAGLLEGRERPLRVPGDAVPLEEDRPERRAAPRVPALAERGAAGDVALLAALARGRGRGRSCAAGEGEREEREERESAGGVHSAGRLPPLPRGNPQGSPAARGP